MSKQITESDLQELRKEIAKLDRKIEKLTNLLYGRKMLEKRTIQFEALRKEIARRLVEA